MRTLERSSPQNPINSTQFQHRFSKMTEEKAAPPPSYNSYPTVMQAEKRTEKKWMWGLLFYAGAVTAALITVSVLGHVYIRDVAKCSQEIQPDVKPEEEHDIRHYQEENEDTGKVDYDLDLTADKEIIHFTGIDGKNSSIAVFDFKANIVGLYNSQTDGCYLIGGIDSRIPSTSELDQFLQNHEKEPQTEVKLSYVVNRERQVKKLDMLPAELLNYCWGKNVYWMERTDEPSGARQKRGWCIRVRWGRWYFNYCW